MKSVFQKISRFVNADFDSAMFFLYMFFYVVCYAVASGIYAVCGQWDLALIPFVGIFISIFSTLIHVKGWKRPAALLRTISTAVIIFVTAYYSGGISAFPIIFLSGAALGAYLVVGKTAGFLVASLSLVLMAITYGLETPPSVLTPAQMHFAAIIVQCINIPFVVLVGAIYGARADVFRLRSENEKQKALKSHQKTVAVMDAIRGSILSVNADFQLTEKNSITVLTFGSITGFDEVLQQLEVDKPAELREALAAILGEHVLNYETNELCLATRGKIKGRRHLITWKPLVDAQEIVQELVVAFIDNEDELKAKEGAEESAAVNAYIGILSDLGQERSLFIIDNFIQAMAYSRQKIPCDAPAAFREVHTLKGVARTLKFDRIAGMIHEIESALNRPDEALRLLQEVELEFAKVQSAAKKLRFDANSIRIDKNLIGKALRNQTEREFLLDLKYTTLQGILESFRATLPEEARRRDKPTPRLILDIPKIYLPDGALQLLSRILIHIFSNALDHGIETPETRQKQQKRPEGTITIRAELADKLVIRIQDDGAGLALGHIFSKAQARRLVDPNRSYSAQEKAAFIFEAEFSTKDSVSETSGRGVGMDAVKASITEYGGRVWAEVQLDQNFSPWELVIELPLSEEITLLRAG